MKRVQRQASEGSRPPLALSLIVLELRGMEHPEL